MEDVLTGAIISRMAELSLGVPVPHQCEWKFCMHKGSITTYCLGRGALLNSDSG